MIIDMKEERMCEILMILLLLCVPVIKSDEMCDAIIIDAITILQNGTIVMFRKNQVWLFEKGKQLLGPCPIGGVFEQMKGPVDAALTITSHESITQFIGSSIYFENGNYFTYRNLGLYNVEWGALTYLPNKGTQAKMGATVPQAAKLMARQISAAYFDPIDGKSKFIFADGSVLAFTFELGAEYDTPLVSTLTSEFKKYGIDSVPNSISAALTLTTDKVHELYLFDGSNYCSFKLSPDLSNQKCEWRAVRDGFLNCNQIVRKNGFCGKYVVASETDRIAVTDKTQEQSIIERKDFSKGVVNPGSGGIVGRHAAPQAERRNSANQNTSHTTKTPNSGYSFISHSILPKLIMNFIFILYIQIFF